MESIHPDWTFEDTVASLHPNSLCLKIVLHHTQDFWRRITGWPRKTSKPNRTNARLHFCCFSMVFLFFRCVSFWNTSIFANAFAVLRFMFITNGMPCLYAFRHSLHFFTMFLQFLLHPASAIAWSSWHSFCSHPQKPSLLQWAQGPNAQDARNNWISREMRVPCACDACCA